MGWEVGYGRVRMESGDERVEVTGEGGSRMESIMMESIGSRTKFG